jgi:hypothetical protein
LEAAIGIELMITAFRLRPGVATAFELKLGLTWLTKTRLDDEWLQPCVSSHGGRRWSGNVIAVLDRRFPNEAVTELVARTATERLKLTRSLPAPRFSSGIGANARACRSLVTLWPMGDISMVALTSAKPIKQYACEDGPGTDTLSV